LNDLPDLDYYKMNLVSISLRNGYIFIACSEGIAVYEIFSNGELKSYKLK
jgi:hypothetical protein